MSVTFDRLIEDEVLSPLQQAFGDMIRRLDSPADENVVLAAVMASEQLGRGHVCFDLESASDIAFTTADGDFAAVRYDDWPEIAVWQQSLDSSRLVTLHESDETKAALDRPLVFDRRNRRVYLSRYWFFERELAERISQRLNESAAQFDEEELRRGLARLFPNRQEESEHGQCLAVAGSIDRPFAVITGGPGTGKTTTVARLLALRLMQESTRHNSNPQAGNAAEPDLKIVLIAPTGKAAQRLNESLTRAAGDLDVEPWIREKLATVTAATIHRALGWTPKTPERGGPYRHSAEHPLDADVVLIDEASMVDIALMYRVFDAVPLDAQIILIGDRDQLSSVEAGSVLGDLCGDNRSAEISTGRDRSRKLEERTGVRILHQEDQDASLLDESIMSLQYSHRFSSDSKLGRLAAAVRTGDADAAVSLLQAGEESELLWLNSREHALNLDEVVRHAALGYEEYLQSLQSFRAGDASLLKLLNRVRVLCAHRDGNSGENTLNRRVIDRLSAAGLVRPHSGNWFGRPVMITRNDYRLGLFNGDVGIAVRHPEHHGPAVLFEDVEADSGCRWIPESLITDAQDCFAMTIHKSQGSEFHNVLLVLPAADSPLLTRELIYTAITRVKDEYDPETGNRLSGRLCIAGNEAVLRAALARRNRRISGLRQAIESRLSSIRPG